MSIHNFKLSKTIHRVILIGSLNDYGAVCAACLALSPFLQTQKVVITQHVTFAGDGNAKPTSQTPPDSPSVSWGSEETNQHQKKGAHEAAAALDAIREEALRTYRNGGSEMDVPYQYYYGRIGPKKDEIPALLEHISLHADGPLPINLQHDLLVCVLRGILKDDSIPNPRAIPEIERLCNLSGNTFSGHLLLIVDSDPYSVELLNRFIEFIQKTSKVAHASRLPNLIVVRTEDFSPPALHFMLTKCSVMRPSGILGMIESVSAGIALGVLTYLPVFRRDDVPFVPIDVAINTGLLAFTAIQNNFIQPSLPIGASIVGTADTRVVRVDVNNRNSLVWGMVAEYILDYYGRYVKKISTVFPAEGFLSNSPKIQFLFSTQDVMNWGPEAIDYSRCREQSKAQSRRRRLFETFPDKKKISNFFLHLDKIIQNVEAVLKHHNRVTKKGEKSLLRLVSFGKGHINGKDEKIGGNDLNGTVTPHISCADSSAIFGSIAYQDLIELLQTTHHTAPQSQYVSLNEVEWSMYIRCIARSVLQHFALCWLRVGQVYQSTPQLMRLPKPVHSFVNDFNYVSEAREPPFPSKWRQFLGPVDHSIRAGMCATGCRGPMVKGLTLQVLSTILENPSIQKEISNTAISEAQSVEKIKERAERMILRIGDTQNHFYCRSIGFLVQKFLNTVYCGVSCNDGTYERLFRWSRMPCVELVYIPLHRSYSDFLLVSDILASMGLSPPHVVTGEDFLGLGKFSELMRGSGSFFMRRNFRGDTLYTALFRKYVHQLMIRHLPIEFFIEAMRSRTGKTKTPKLGMLKFIMEVFFNLTQKERLHDVLFVPISISYDEVLEAKIFAEELLGIPKPKETLSNMVKAFKNLNHRYGNIYMHFGDAISLREFIETWDCCQPLPKSGNKPISSTPQNGSSDANPSGSPTLFAKNAMPEKEYKPPAALLEALGWHITHRLQENIVITPAAVVASAVECTLPVCEAEGTSLSLTRLHTTIVMLIQAVKQRGGNMSSIFYTLPSTEDANSSTDRTNFVRSLASTPDIARVMQQGVENLGQFLRVQSSNVGVGEVMYHPPTATSRLAVHISANQLVHVFIDEAVVAVVAHGYGTLTSSSSSTGNTACVVNQTVLKSITRLLRQLLSKEFPDFSQSCPDSFDAWMQHTLARFHLDDSKWNGSDDEYCVKGNEAHGKDDLISLPITPLNDFLLQLIFPYMDILYLVCVATLVLLEMFPEQPLYTKPMITAIFKTALSLFEEQNIIRYVTICNNDTVNNCLDSLLKLPLMHNLSKFTLLERKQRKHAPKLPSLDDKNVSSSMKDLIKKLHALRLPQSMDPNEEMHTVKRTLLRCYADVSEGAKL
ncbi:unnamed protein product [Phytomonas sp. Hart1]|nr:unnamed protein product [Phytomonas sp. Hart1]|eukprot:CCW66616.1 unnamed protein product [Phytomonas sp. isolate Hart1]